MMPIFGDVTRFAVEFELDRDYGSVWMFGRFLYWCGGQRVGNDESTSLRDVLFQLEQMEWATGRRSSARFGEMPAREMFRLISGALWGPRDNISDFELELSMENGPGTISRRRLMCSTPGKCCSLKTSMLEELYLAKNLTTN